MHTRLFTKISKIPLDESSGILFDVSRSHSNIIACSSRTSDSDGGKRRTAREEDINIREDLETWAHDQQLHPAS